MMTKRRSDDVASLHDPIGFGACLPEGPGCANPFCDKCWEDAEELDDGGTCSGCGCTDDHACEGGCVWVTPTLCSQCARKQVAS